MSKNKEIKELLDQLLHLGEVGAPTKDIEELLVNKTKELLMETLKQAKTASDFRKFTIICTKVLLEDYAQLTEILQMERDEENGN